MEGGYIKKRLVFYFYASENFRENEANKIHLKCLKHYANIFNEALFIISVDDTENEGLIWDVESELIDLGIKDMHFKVHKNNAYYEVQPFWNEIVEKLGKNDGLTFFCHNKGSKNLQKDNANKDNVESWILGMYYLNLEFINEVEWSLCASHFRFYGAFLLNLTNEWAHEYIYPGTFFWINCPLVDMDIKYGDIELPETYHHRGFAEIFPGLLYKGSPDYCLYSHKGIVLDPYDCYTETAEKLRSMLEQTGDSEGFEIFKNSIM